MNEWYADLHTHTTASDGTNPPKINVRMAKEAGLAAVGITDHDTIAGIAEAMEEGKRLGVEVVPGVEISTVMDGLDVHVLGYYIDYASPEFLRKLEQLRNTRERRNEMMVERLRQLGIDITMEEVVANAKRGNANDETIGRPHIADLLVKKGFVSSMQEAFDRYLGKSGKAYVNPPRIHPFEAIDWIKAAGGCAVLAHPGLYDDDNLVRQIIEYGVDGIEAYHADHDADDEARYLEMAARYRLIVTAGSDFHGERHGEVFHSPVGARKIHIDTLRLLKERAQRNLNTNE